MNEEQKNRVSTNKFDEKDLMIIGDLIEKLKKFLNDEISINIIAELFINNELSYEEILTKIEIQPDKLQAILKQLSDNDLIYQKNNNYSLAISHFQNIIDSTTKFREKANLLRESRLFYQILFQILLNREKNLLENISSIDYKNQYAMKDIFNDFPYLTFQFVNKEIFTKYQKKFLALNQEFHKEIREYEEKNPVSKPDPFFMYFGYLYFPELEKE